MKPEWSGKKTFKTQLMLTVDQYRTKEYNSLW